ncbi:MAG: hypothetical protein ABFD80_10290 [Acidobacteriota bacterium]
MSLAIRAAIVILLAAGTGIGALEAASTRGDTVNIRLIDGSHAYGELLRIEGRNLVLYSAVAKTEKRVPIDQVKTIQVYLSRPFEPRFLNGAGLGMALGLLSSSSHMETEQNLGSAAAPVGGALFGGVFGGLLEFIGKKSEMISLTVPPVGDKIAVLDSLKRYAREERAKRRDWLRGFRLSWRPFFHVAWPLTITGKVTLPEPYAETDFEMTHLPDRNSNHKTRFRLDYDIKPWFSLGVEYFSLDHYTMVTYIYPEPQVVVEGENYVSSISAHAETDASVTMLGISMLAWPGGLRGEAGIGIARCRLENFGPWGWSGDAQRTSRLPNRVALQLGASWEFSPDSPVSAGLYFDYLFLKPACPVQTFNGQLDFRPGTEYHPSEPVAFQMDSQVVFPAQKFNLSGFIFGVLIRVK